jgi:hypothetical protein
LGNLDESTEPMHMHATRLTENRYSCKKKSSVM